MSALVNATEAATDTAVDAIWKGLLEVIDRHDGGLRPHLLAWMDGEIEALRATLALELCLQQQLSTRDPAVVAQVAPIAQDIAAIRLRKRLLKLCRQGLREV